MQVIFCHGLESGPFGRKYHALYDAGINVVSPDFQGMGLADRVQKLVPILPTYEKPILLVGSSYGGITAVLSSMQAVQQGVEIAGLLLLAPALLRKEHPFVDTALQAVAPTVIIHGRHDDIVPIEGSQAYAKEHSATLIEVEDDHRLAQSLERIVWETKRFLAW